MKKRRNYNLILGLALTCAMVGLIVMGWLWTPFDPNAMDPASRLQSPSLTHLLGTDNFGRDIFSRVLQGAGATFLIGVAVVLIGGVCGVLIGGFCGYYGGWLDDLLDVFLEFSCFFCDPMDVGNLISGSSTFSKTSWNIWKFTVHILLKPGLENFEHYFTSV